MKWSRIVLAGALLAAGAVMGCGGASGGLASDGGQSGTGISAAIRGNVAAVIGPDQDVADIRVSLTATNLATQTDAQGRFELRGNVSGTAELRFERPRDRLLARTTVVIPAGGVLELQQIVIDVNSGQARPSRERVEFQGLVERLDCAAGAIVVTPKDDDPKATGFIIEVASATIHHNDVRLACLDLRVGDSLQVLGETSNGATLVNADLELERAVDGNHNVQFQGAVTALDCTAGTILVTPNDNDPATTMFTIQVASATIRRADVVIGCGDLRVGDSLQVHADTSDESTLFNADVAVENNQHSVG